MSAASPLLGQASLCLSTAVLFGAKVLAQSKEFIAKYLERSATAMPQAGNGAEEEAQPPVQQKAKS